MPSNLDFLGASMKTIISLFTLSLISTASFANEMVFAECTSPTFVVTILGTESTMTAYIKKPGSQQADEVFPSIVFDNPAIKPQTGGYPRYIDSETKGQKFSINSPTIYFRSMSVSYRGEKSQSSGVAVACKIFGGQVLN
jgi:hypothetical protein